MTLNDCCGKRVHLVIETSHSTTSIHGKLTKHYADEYIVQGDDAYCIFNSEEFCRINDTDTFAPLIFIGRKT